MKVLMVGDIVGTTGLDLLRRFLPSLKREEGVDVCIVNGENSADGNGVTVVSAEQIFTYGADVITTGNHAFRRREAYEFFDETECLLRPANYLEKVPGHGYCVLDKGRVKVGVINLMGTMYMDPIENPFIIADKILEELKDCRIIIVDFHAETTSEKRAIGFYLDGRVSVVAGTHTHVQTADEQILPNGTGYITDLGMTGPQDSVLGVVPEIVIDKFKYNMPARFDWKQGSGELDACLFEIDENSGRTTSVRRIILRENQS